MTSHDDRIRYFDLFQRHDLDHDGRLTGEELMAALRSLGRATESAGVQHLLRTHDTDGSRSIDFDEFLAVVDATGPEPEASPHVRRENSP